LVNLVSNGLKYGKEDEDVVLKINVHTTEQGNHLEFKITNPIGVVGIPNSEQLFQRYYRSESAKRYAGSGLGLWLSRELAKILGGNIVYNHDDTHIHFSFSITGNA
jgi:signal transduction histidine kinase